MVRKGSVKKKGKQAIQHVEREESDEEEVFNLTSKNQSSDDSESDQYSSNDSDSDSPRTKTDLDLLVDSLPADIRQRVKMGKKIQSDEEDDSEDDSDNDEDEDGDEDDNQTSWGKKSNYYSTDTADLEIGQDLIDAEDEEKAAKELQHEQLVSRSEEDYLDSDNESNQKKSNRLTSQLERRSKSLSGKMVVEKVERNLQKLSKKQRLEILKKESPEMLGLCEELNDKLKELKSRIEPLADTLKKMSGPVDDELCLYLQSKQQLLLSYCVNILFYLTLKVEGASLQSHPVMKQLLKQRYLMEKMRQLDSKLSHQIERLLSSQSNSQNENQTSSQKSSTLARPNISALIDNEDGEDESDNEDNATRQKQNSNNIYRPQKLNAVPYQNDKEISKLEQKIQSKKKKIINSEILETLREEFGTAPEVSHSSGMGQLTKQQHDIDNEIEERRKFEEERFVRLTLSKKDKQALRKRRELNLNQNQELVADMGDIDDLSTLATLTNTLNSQENSGKSQEKSRLSARQSINSETLSNALQKAVSVFTQEPSKKSKKDAGKKILRNVDEEDFVSGRDDDNDNFDDNYDDHDEGNDSDGFDYGEDENYDDILKGHDNEKQNLKRRRAPEEDLDDNSNEMNLFDEFSSKKKQFLDKKSQHYTKDLRFGSSQDLQNDNEESNDHRAASYEIMSNRGLRPHRSKKNRNPRVKKREAFSKAIQKRKSQVREVSGDGVGKVSYGGELTGIKANLSRSRRFQN